jgi:single-strand DNA-binding protein
MSFQAAVHGRLGGDPRQIQTKTDTVMAVCSLAVSVDTRGEEQETEWLSVLAFGRVAEALLRHRKGDMLSAAGRVQLNTWDADGGEQRRQFQIVADSVISSRTVGPGGGRKPKQGHGIAQARNGAQSLQEPPHGNCRLRPRERPEFSFDDETAF